MDVKKLIFATLFLSFCLLPSTYAASKSIAKELSLASNVPELAKKQGYLMVYVNVDGVAPSINFSKVSTKRTDFLIDSSFTYSKDYSLDLKGVAPGVYFIPMFAGVYQITRINAPFYGLPYWLATEKQEKWRFAIEANRVNFIGEIFIAKERGANEIEVHLLNRVATHQQLISNALALLPKAFPLTLKPGYQDEFLMELEK